MINDQDGDGEAHYDFWPNSLELGEHCIDIHDIVLY